jgi:hypothetical protein
MIEAFISEEGYLVLAESGGKRKLAIPIESARHLAALLMAERDLGDRRLDEPEELTGEFSVDP